MTERDTITLVLPGWSRHAAKLCAALAFAVVVSDASATQKKFTAGTAVKADDFNSNFDELYAAVASLNGRITEWQTYTPTASNTAGAALATKTVVGSVGSTGYWRRVGDSAEIRIELNVTCTTGYPRFSLPPQMTVDYSKINQYYPAVGIAWLYNNTTGNGAAVAVVVRDATWVALDGSAPGTPPGFIDCGALGANGDVSLVLTVPIAEFAASM